MSPENTLTRRQVLIKMASVLVVTSLIPYSKITFATQNQIAGLSLVFMQFIKVSQKITAYTALNATLSARYFNALHIYFPELDEQIARLYLLSEKSDDALGLKQRAVEQGLGPLLNAIVMAWYTGTVNPDGNGGGDVIAYKEALMYRTVDDALIVPTWCTFGPMWWAALPPGVTREPAIPATDLPVAAENNKDRL